MMINCRQFQERVHDIALDDPSVALPEELRQHLDGCDSCQTTLSELQAAWSLIPGELMRSPVNPALESDLMRRISAEPLHFKSAAAAPDVDTQHFDTQHVDTQRQWWMPYALAASVLLALVSLTTVLSPTLFDGSRQQVSNKDLEKIEDIAKRLNQFDRLEQVFGAPNLHYASLKSVDSEPRIQGYLLYDLESRQTHFFGFDLVPVRGRYYCLWLLDRDQCVVSKANIEPDAGQNLGTAIVNLPAEITSLHEIVVTLESGPNPDSPSVDVRMRAFLDVTALE